MTAIIDQDHQRIDPSKLFPAPEPANVREINSHYPEIAEVKKLLGAIFIGNFPLEQILYQSANQAVSETPTPPPDDMRLFYLGVEFLGNIGINPPPTLAPTATEAPSTATPAPIVVESGAIDYGVQNTETFAPQQEKSKSDTNFWTYLFLILAALVVLGFAKDVLKSFKHIHE